MWAENVCVSFFLNAESSFSITSEEKTPASEMRQDLPKSVRNEVLVSSRTQARSIVLV